MAKIQLKNNEIFSTLFCATSVDVSLARELAGQSPDLTALNVLTRMQCEQICNMIEKKYKRHGNLRHVYNYLLNRILVLGDDGNIPPVINPETVEQLLDRAHAMLVAQCTPARVSDDGELLEEFHELDPRLNLAGRRYDNLSTYVESKKEVARLQRENQQLRYDAASVFAPELSALKRRVGDLEYENDQLKNAVNRAKADLMVEQIKSDRKIVDLKRQLADFGGGIL